MHTVTAIRHSLAHRRGHAAHPGITGVLHATGTPAERNELLTPLTCMLGWAQLGQVAPDTTEAAFAAIERNARRQQHLLRDLFIVLRLWDGCHEQQPQQVDAWALAVAIAECYLPALQARGITLHLPAPAPALPVVIDPLHLRQALGHLLDNAVQYTPAGGRVTLAGVQEGQQAVLRLYNTGRGLPAAALACLRRPGRLFARDPRAGGIGFGLALAQGLIGLAGGTLSARNGGSGKGSTITLHLPLAEKP